MPDIFRICREFQRSTAYMTGAEEDPARTYDMKNYPGPYKAYEGLRKFDLPRNDYSDWPTPIGRAFAQRRSKRNFLPDALSPDELGFMLWASQGITADMQGYKLRTAPSAGALYPIETYLVVRAVDGLPQGKYHLDVRDWKLDLMSEGDFVDPIFKASHSQEMVRLAAVNFVWSAVIERSSCKYYERAYRYIYEDVGHVSENLQLACAAMDKVGSAVIGAYFDDQAADLFDLDMESEPVVMMGSAGRVSGADFREDRRTYMEKLKKAREAK